ncbi:MAG: serine--tRNA ligase [Parcubacteria group bacterium]|nr:serine--tRNA ligase [Parcubacteria group bacterium]
MLDIKKIRENPHDIERGIRVKGFQVELGRILKLDENLRKRIKDRDDLRAEQNRESEKIPALSGKAREDLLHRLSELKGQIENLELEVSRLEQDLEKELQLLPNPPLPEVPPGKSEADNKVLHTWGKLPAFDFESRDHVALGQALDIIDFERGSKVAGSGFYYLKNEGVMLELALVHYALDFLKQKGFTLWLTPNLARERFYLGTGYLPRGPEAQTYEIKDSDLGLIATAEVTLAGIHTDEILDRETLPRRYAGYSQCFRQEAGGYGKYSKGLYRVHQFTKVEMFAYTTPENSPKMHGEFLALEEGLWQGLGIPYRVVEMCAGDLGAQAARKFDLEAWMPGRGDWGEVTSTANTTDYQARRLGVRYRMHGAGQQGVEYVHTLNGTALATSRAIIAILENFQQRDGSVKMPGVLVQYLGFDVIGKK